MDDRVILLVEDSPRDVALTQRAFKKNNIMNDIVVAKDGVEALDYLFSTGAHEGRDPNVMPALILLLLVSLASGCRAMERNEILDPAPGIALTLATERAQSIQELTYNLAFAIPSDVTEPIAGHELIRFSTRDLTRPVILDFTPGADHLKSVTVGGKPSNFRVVQDHIIIPKEEIASGYNII